MGPLAAEFLNVPPRSGDARVANTVTAADLIPPLSTSNQTWVTRSGGSRPTSRWKKHSVVWFSQQVTRSLGMPQFANYEKNAPVQTGHQELPQAEVR